ncbi:hypothetical protein H2203_002514 [Taxawa tesnikishii (nom. ined.)]|nr:hypothetical protein H2203_002514 [Dothideales sp. JES 119]
MDTVSHLFSQNFHRTFAEKAVEYTTTDRQYCSAIDCADFIAPDDIDDNVATCPKCSTRTCTTCKGAAHTGDCPGDPGYQALMELAAEQGWKQYHGCQRMIGISTGCNHMVPL